MSTKLADASSRCRIPCNMHLPNLLTGASNNELSSCHPQAVWVSQATAVITTMTVMMATMTRRSAKRFA